MAEEEDRKQTEISDEQPRQPLPLPLPLPGGHCGGCSNERKTWRELVGLPSEEAERKIKEEIPRIKVQIVPPNSMVTMDFRTDRVRIFTDSEGKVSRAPMIG